MHVSQRNGLRMARIGAIAVCFLCAKLTKEEN